METGFRERQGISPYFNRIMRFEPRPGYFQPNPGINRGALAGDQQRPAHLAGHLARQAGRSGRSGLGGELERLLRQAARRRPGELHGHGRRVLRRLGLLPRQPRLDAARARAARRGARLPVGEPAGRQRHLLALRHHQREHDRLRRQHHLRPLHGLGRRRLGAVVRRHLRVRRRQRVLRPHVAASQPGLHLGRYGHGRDLAGNCGRTGYLGYAYLETPGNAFDAIDNDEDGIIDERRDGGPGERDRRGRPRSAPRSTAHYDLARFEAAYGPLDKRPAYRVGRWWTGDEDMDWNAEFHDVGADGVAETGDTGEGRRHADRGRAQLRPHRPQRVGPDRAHRLQDEPHPRRPGKPEPTTDNILFYTDTKNWPQRLYEQFTDPDSGRALRLGAGRRTTTSGSCSPRARSRCRPGRPSASAWRSPTAPT